MKCLLLTSLAVTALAVPLFAHGGQYKGPGDAGGSAAGGGGSVNPPTNPGGATTPGPGAPPGGATGAGPRGGTTRGGRQARGADDRGGTTGSAVDFGPGYEIWEFWWEANKDRFLDLKRRMEHAAPVSGSIGVLTRKGRDSRLAPSSRPTRAQIEHDVVPVLLELVAGNADRDVLDSAILALGRVCDEAMTDEVIAAARPLLRHEELSVRSSAALTLGVLGSDDALELLVEILYDTSKGRQAVGQSKVSDLVRAFAALALGLIDSPAAIDTLVGAVERLGDSERDVKVCSIVALGLMENDERARAVDYLVGKLADRKLDQTIRSYVPTSLGKVAPVGDRAAIGALVRCFLDDDSGNLVRQSAAIALGRLATVADTDAVDALVDFIEEGRDEQTRHFAFISLAKIGARAGDRAEHPEVHERLVDLFATEMDARRAGQRTNRSWAALAGALYERGHDDAQVAILERLRAGYEGEKDPSYKSAYALALGLVGDRGMGARILDDLLASTQADFVGYAAVALGLMRYDEAAAPLRAMLRDKTISPTLRRELSTGLGLLGDTQAVAVLVETLQSAQTFGVSAAVARALALIGDEQAIAPLVALCRDASGNDVTRAFACIALGLVAEKTELPFNARISEDNNYRAGVAAIAEVLDIL